MYSNAILRLIVGMHVGVVGLLDRARESERGQSTAEYALVLAGIALVIGGLFKAGMFTDFLEKAIKSVTGAIK